MARDQAAKENASANAKEKSAAEGLPKEGARKEGGIPVTVRRNCRLAGIQIGFIREWRTTGNPPNSGGLWPPTGAELAVLPEYFP